MEHCVLCLDLNYSFPDFIKVDTKQWDELNITKVLETHFWPLNTIHTNSWICVTCWQKVNDFHQFYLQTEEAHLKFREIKVEDGNQSLDSKEENEGFISRYLEPEILIDQKALEFMEVSKEMCIKEDENKTNLNETPVLNEDPLEKLRVNKPKYRKCTKNKTTSETKSPALVLDEKHIKSEPVDSSDNDDDSDSENDDCDDDNYLPDNSKTGNTKKRERTNQKENDSFIAEHFKQMFCAICDAPFENFRLMKAHFNSIHNQNGYLVCCTRKFYQRNHLVDHLHSHFNPDRFKCNECGKILANRKIFRNHMVRVHRPNDASLRHYCDVCDKSFGQLTTLRKHKLKHLPDEEKNYPCTECGKFYSSSYHLNQHTQAVHLKKFVKICYICGKSISNSADYKTHMNKHEGIPQPILSCDICGLRMTTERGLKRHKKGQHPVGGKQDHPCPICNKISPTERALRKHVNTMHEKGYDHKCTVCEKSFKRAEALREHMATHTGIALYKCPWCPKTSNSNGNMHAHRKKAHPKEWEEAKLQKYSGHLPEGIDFGSK